MTEPTPKPEDTATRRGLPRFTWLATSGCVVFAAISLSLVALLPGPHSRAAYLIIGTLATLGAIITMFTGLLLTRSRSASKRR